MSYTDKYNELAALFSMDLNEIAIRDSGIRIVNVGFVSDRMPERYFSECDMSITENITFSYPVFVPARESKKVILLLHGLNERSWTKYLTWAYFLSGETGSYVILFPISFHINRSPVSWRDPREMIKLLNERRKARGETGKSSYANIALSNRLIADPKRFVKSGYQTISDIVVLLQSINDGCHPVVPGGSRVNIFAYSIGAFLAQIMMMADIDRLLSDSKLFMFCGGSVFSNMHGDSRLIMDNEAFETVHSYYMNNFEKEISMKDSIVNFLASGKAGMAFRAMIDLRRFRKTREKALNRMNDRIFSVALAKDLVIPAAGIVETLRSRSRKVNCRVEVWDFPYPYTHENPFPVNEMADRDEVDKSFEHLISAASSFL